jgi:hypothetical protein
MLSVFGWWVAWVYALSLALPIVLPKGVDPDDPAFRDWAAEVAFEGNGFSLVESDLNGLLRLEAVLTKPVPVAMELPLDVQAVTAKDGRDYRVASQRAAVMFEKGATRGTLRTVPERGPDIVPINDQEWNGPRSFRLRLVGNEHVVVAGDSGLCTVTIQDDETAPKNATPVRFTKASLETTERDLTSAVFEATAESAVAERTPVEFHLFRSDAAGRRQVTTFQRFLEPGERSVALRLQDVLDAETLTRLGISDDASPGPDETWELDMLAPLPLFPGDPSSCRIVAANDDAAPDVRIVYFDEQGQEINWLDPKGSVGVELVGEPLETDSSYTLTVDGKDLPDAVTVPAGKRRCRPMSLAGCGLGGRKGRRCGVGARCGGGCCRGQKGCGGKAVVGAPVPGDALVVLVNNERLHEKGDRIVDEVRAVLGEGKARLYEDAVVVLNREGEDRMTADGGAPVAEKAYRPFENAGDDGAGQLKRIEELVARKREAAEHEDLRAVVIWPERDLAAGEGLAPTGEDGTAPISFLFPDADPSYARGMRKGLVPSQAVPGTVTVRSPATTELKQHLENVLENARPERGSDDVEAALQRTL